MKRKKKSQNLTDELVEWHSELWSSPQFRLLKNRQLRPTSESDHEVWAILGRPWVKSSLIKIKIFEEEQNMAKERT